MVTSLGSHSPRLSAVRALLTKEGRRDQRRFSFEGPTLLAEALAAGIPIDAVYATETAYARLPERLRGEIVAPVYLVGDAALRRLSDVKTPAGIVATAPLRLGTVADALRAGEACLLLAGVADPGNAGTLIRSAEIFGVGTILFDEAAVEPYNPKVVRAAMGALFRARIGVVQGAGLAGEAAAHGYRIVATDRSGAPARGFVFPERCIVAVCHERSGLAALAQWDALVAVPQREHGESLNAAVAGSIVLYELAEQRRMLSSGLSTRRNA